MVWKKDGNTLTTHNADHDECHRVATLASRLIRSAALPRAERHCVTCMSKRYPIRVTRPS